MDSKKPSAAPVVATLEYYDKPTLIFHWLTALLVVVQFATAMIWNYVTPHDRYWRPLLEETHVSLGIILAAVIVLRVFWRFTGMRHLLPEAGISGVLSRIMYLLLYVLLVAEAVLGFILRWRQGEDFTFFGLFTVPALLGEEKAAAHTIEELHNWVGWAIIILAAGHAVAALVHHYILKDKVMARMSFRHTNL